MSPNGQTAIVVQDVPMGPGQRFAWHSHPDDQLAWTDGGVLTVESESGTWVLPPTRALWIPAGVVHETSGAGVTTLRGVYLKPDRRRTAQWPAPQPMAVTPLLAELIRHLADTRLDPHRRRRAEAVLVDLLEPIEVTAIELPMPTDPRARDLAQALLANPADPRSLPEWGHAIGASGRTLTRAFLADTGIPFSRWRTAVRLRAALPRLAAGEPVSAVAAEVGFQTPSAFVAAFRREIGTTPGAYFKPALHTRATASAAHLVQPGTIGYKSRRG
jgi:AraC-like DNA-binding protein